MSHDSGVRVQQFVEVGVDSYGHQKKKARYKQKVRKPAEIENDEMK